MTDKEKLDAIRAEIHRLVDVRGYDREMANYLFAFMDSLPNEPLSEGLEKAAINYMKTENPPIWGLHDGFIAGANWQKQQMMKDAIEGIVRPDDSEIWCNLASFNLKDGDKVKIVIVKNK